MKTKRKKRKPLTTLQAAFKAERHAMEEMLRAYVDRTRVMTLERLWDYLPVLATAQPYLDRMQQLEKVLEFLRHEIAVHQEDNNTVADTTLPIWRKKIEDVLLGGTDGK